MVQEAVTVVAEVVTVKVGALKALLWFGGSRIVVSLAKTFPAVGQSVTNTRTKIENVLVVMVILL